MTSPVDNQPPLLNSIRSKTINEKEPLELHITGSDPENKNYYIYAENLPEGAMFNRHVSGKDYAWFFFQPRFDQSGTYDITFKISDGNLSDSETITINVTDSELVTGTSEIQTLSPLTRIKNWFRNFFKL